MSGLPRASRVKRVGAVQGSRVLLRERTSSSPVPLFLQHPTNAASSLGTRWPLLTIVAARTDRAADVIPSCSATSGTLSHYVHLRSCRRWIQGSGVGHCSPVV